MIFTKCGSIQLPDAYMFKLGPENIKFITQFFLAILQRQCTLVTQSTLGMSGHTHQNDSINL